MQLGFAEHRDMQLFIGFDSQIAGAGCIPLQILTLKCEVFHQAKLPEFNTQPTFQPILESN
jgi:hypothetical protein